MPKPTDKPQWVRLAEQFEQSGLTQKQFAQQQALPLSTLQSWVYRRRRQVRPSSAVPMRLLPVEVLAASAVSAGSPEVLAASVVSAGHLELVTAEGVRLRFAAGTDVAYLARLAAALRSASC